MRKKISLTILLIMLFFCSYSQEKGFHLTLSGNLGGTTFGYKTDIDQRSKFGLGYGGTIGAQYFFNYNWGISLGVGLSQYKGYGRYANEYTYEGMTDADPFFPTSNYNLHLKLGNWKEEQKAYFLEIPLMAVYQKKWGKRERLGMYAGLGAKLQLPIIKQEYRVIDGSRLEVSGIYSEDHGMIIDDLPAYGFGTNDNTGYKGDMKLKLGLAGTAEVGMLVSLSQRIDLSVGAYFDYSFLNMKDGETGANGDLISPEDGSNTIHPSSYVGDNIQYNGYVNSKIVERVNPYSIGGKVGLRVKLGKLKERIIEDEESEMILDKQENMDLSEIEESLRKILDKMDKDDKRKDSLMIISMDYLQGNAKDEDGLTAEDRDILKERVFFDLNSSILHPGSKIVLDRKINLMNRYPEIRVRIIGNTCDLGQEKINIPLGLRRAKSVQEYMSSKGIDSRRLVPSTQANNDPLVPNTNEENRAVNRRCDFEIDRR